ncbi:MAG: DUF1311 domain-containing protein [Zetaproteobacteria bacterium]|nr:DUF1311 domain-containing protein [Zetaproteobacteria bacterium]
MLRCRFFGLLAIFIGAHASLLYAADYANDPALVKKIAQKADASSEDVQEMFRSDCQGGSTLGVLQCANIRAVASDELMQLHYQELMRSLASKSEKKRMIIAQKAWVVFRDQECDFVAEHRSDNIGYGIVFSNCLSEMNQAREATLNHFHQ